MRGGLWVAVAVAVVALFTALWGYYMAPETYEPVHILAFQDEQNQLPVFAQFVVRQAIHLDEPAYVREVRVPMHMPADPGFLKVSLYRNASLVYAWQTVPAFTGKGLQVFSLPVPMLLDGLLELKFDGQSISYEDAARSPALYTEDDTQAFPSGSYRIAENRKEGNVSLSFVAERWRYQRLAEENPHFFEATVSRLVIAALLVVGLLYLPSFLTRPFGVRL
ncbi:MAG: hypothetical protein HYZ62_01465 [Candidatus Andersenbacteria bacterium]|nr:hypothetical protein [Candidatus Andersenbacteria bacterium]